MILNKWPAPYSLNLWEPNPASGTPIRLYQYHYALSFYRLSGGKNPKPSGSPPSKYIAEPSAVVVHRAVKTSSRTKMTFLSRPVLRVWGHNSGSLVIPAFNIGATTPEQNQNITSISCQIEDPKSQYLETPQSMRRS